MFDQLKKKILAAKSTNWQGGTLVVVNDAQGMENVLRTIDGSTAQGS